MKPATATLVGLCVVCATVVAICAGTAWFIRTSGVKPESSVGNEAKPAEPRAEAKEPRAEKVVVLRARHDLLPRALVRDPLLLFEPESVSSADAPEDYVPLARIEDMTNRVLLRRLNSGEIVTFKDLLSREASVAHFLTPGLRAFTFEVDSKLVARGHVHLESRIDIIGMMEKGKEPTLLLENVRVMDVESSKPLMPASAIADEPGKQPEPAAGGSLLTVETTPEGVLMLTRALAAGPLTLALRPIGEKPRT